MIGTIMIGLAALAFADEVNPKTTVGMPGRLEQVVIPGPLLEARPITDRSVPVVVRVTAAFPHGDAYRYDIEYYALEAGTYDLCEYLQREDGSAATDVAGIVVEVQSTLPPGQVLPNALAPSRLPQVGGYRVLLIVGGVIWVIGLFVILFAGRRRKRAQDVSVEHLMSLEERLQAAIQAAGGGKLDPGECAQLERMVLAYWRRKLSLEEVEASEAMAAMRQNEEARAALEQLEQWLHQPQGRDPDDYRRLVDPPRSANISEPT